MLAEQDYETVLVGGRCFRIPPHIDYDLRVPTVISDLSLTPASVWPALFEAQRGVDARGVCSVEEQVSAMFDSLSDLIWSDRNSLAVVARVDAASNDALAGWRLAWIHSPGFPRFSRMIRPVARLLKWNSEHRDALTDGAVRAGAVHCVGPDQPPSHRRFNQLIGVKHRLGATVPMSETIEVYLMFNRKQEAFTHDEVATALASVHVFRRLAQRWVAQLGILEGRLLSPRERQVLVCLLKGHSEKAGAAQLGMKPSYFHQIVVRIYGKMRVDSRAALLAKCLEAPPASDDLWTGKPLMQIG